MAYGARPEDWARFDLVYGLTEDLLPVVSNPSAKISAHSKLKGLGKTPSLYNGDGEVVGILEWAQKRTKPREIERWAKAEDYGICVQTRDVRALDIDVTDLDLARRIRRAVEDVLGFEPPLRYRGTSAKCLYAFRYEGELYKRVVPVRTWLEPGVEKPKRDIVELLATGQQFVAEGTHTSGDRYEWCWGAHADFPEITEAQLEAIWAAVKTFSIGDEHVSRKRQRGEKIETQDDVALWLVEHAETYGFSRDGDRLYVPCPWKSGHSSDSGETETTWLLAGTNGLQRGHFKCMHASCAGRTDEQFLDEVGYRDADFDVITDEIAALYEAEGGKLPAERPAGKLPLPGFERDKQGKIEPVIQNVAKALQHAEACGAMVGFDELPSELAVMEDGRWRPLRDADAVKLRIALAAIGFKPVGRELMRDGLVMAAETNRFDSGQDWGDAAPQWDGTKRMPNFFSTYFGTVDTPYTSAVSLYVWTALAGRVMDPGCKADMVPILVGPQGCGKSRGVAALAPKPDWFAKLSLHERDEDLARKMRGVVVAELDELRGLDGRDAEAIKSWIAQTEDRWTPKYMEYASTHKRRCIFFGTTNRDDFLADDTGERRWLPMRVGVTRPVDVEAIERDRDQLWAEGLHYWRQRGIMWQDAERLARGEHAQFKKRDAWEGPVAAWLQEAGLDDVKNCEQPFTAMDVLVGVLRMDIKHVTKREEMRVASVLKALGYESRALWIDGKTQKRWVPCHL